METIDAPTTPAAGADAPTAPPVIGQPWHGGIYAGLSKGTDGAPDAHLVLLPDLPPGRLKWADAIAWAEALGEGAHLPSRDESALLYAHVRDAINTGPWYWTSTQYSPGSAYGQDFDGGGTQDGSGKKYEAAARAVRRFNA